MGADPLLQPVAQQPVPAAEPGGIISAAAAAEVDAARARMVEKAKGAQRLKAKAAALKPGQFLWHPEHSAAGDVQMMVSLSEQKAYVFRGGKLIAATIVSTGKRGHNTATGNFTILEKARRHFSSTYNNAPMPNMQRLTWKAIALHAGALPGYPASHGCVRLPLTFSKNCSASPDSAGEFTSSRTRRRLQPTRSRMQRGGAEAWRWPVRIEAAAPSQFFRFEMPRCVMSSASAAQLEPLADRLIKISRRHNRQVIRSFSW